MTYVRLVVLVVGWLCGVARVVPAEQLDVPALAGSWVGKCTQVETAVETGMVLSLQLQSPTLLFGSWRTAGPFFGCPAVDPGGYPLFKGGKRSGWSPHALHINTKTNPEPWGHLIVRTKGTTFIVKGNKACGGLGPKSYKGKGTLVGKTFTLDMKAKLQGETANFACSWYKPF